MIKWVCYLVIGYLLFVGLGIVLGVLNIVPPKVAAPVVFVVVFVATPSIYRWAESKIRTRKEGQT